MTQGDAGGEETAGPGTPEVPGAAGTIVVTGDPTVDWLLVVPQPVDGPALAVTYQWEGRASVQVTAVPGGAALLRDVLAAASPPGGVDGIVLPPAVLRDSQSDAVTRTFAVWQPHSVGGIGGAGGVSPGAAWRLGRFLGQYPVAAASLWDASPPPVPPACVVIDDANLGYRDAPVAWAWLGETAHSSVWPAQIVAKSVSPLATGPLWDMLLAGHAHRLTVYCAANDLRKEYAAIGQPLSWERTGQDVARAVLAHPRLSHAARVVVSLGLGGAVIVERGGDQARGDDPGRATLVYDPLAQEGDWEAGFPGSAAGLGTCVVAALTLAVSAAATRPRGGPPEWTQALKAGLTAGRAVHAGGYERGGDPEDDPAGTDAPLRFPRRRVVRQIQGLIGHIATARPDDPPPGSLGTFRTIPVGRDDGWSIFGGEEGGFRGAAERIALVGDRGAVGDAPVERMGAWTSMERTEIESMRSVRNIVREYLDGTRRVRPLNLAVFGPPGSGKSFAIKQMARGFGGGAHRLGTLEFNLSQFGAPADLPAALERVRDFAVEQTLPLVFWDEFDTALGGRELGWLAQFLAPMQDGTYIDGGVLRPIGPAIFVFAGGTHATMESFKGRAVELPGAKATDFLSRLRGFVDVLGPNPAAPEDRTYLLRRALLLRSLLRNRAPRLFEGERLNIDPGVLRAFLDVPTYLHGARSLESIIDMSALTGSLRYERSALPARHQLGLHVDPDAFLGLVRR